MEGDRLGRAAFIPKLQLWVVLHVPVISVGWGAVIQMVPRSKRMKALPGQIQKQMLLRVRNQIIKTA